MVSISQPPPFLFYTSLPNLISTNVKIMIFLHGRWGKWTTVLYIQYVSIAVMFASVIYCASLHHHPVLKNTIGRDWDLVTASTPLPSRLNLTIQMQSSCQESLFIWWNVVYMVECWIPRTFTHMRHRPSAELEFFFHYAFWIWTLKCCFSFPL